MKFITSFFLLCCIASLSLSEEEEDRQLDTLALAGALAGAGLSEAAGANALTSLLTGGKGGKGGKGLLNLGKGGKGVNSQLLASLLGVLGGAGLSEENANVLANALSGGKGLSGGKEGKGKGKG